MSTSGGGSYSATVPNGTTSEISGSTFTVTCNDANGFALYAVGNSNNTLGNTNLIGTSSNIATNTSGNDSYWAMKVNPTSGNTPTIENSFNNYHVIPNTHTKVASYSSSTGSGSLSVQATYKASISSTQLAGNYLGQVKYTLIHPANEAPVQPIDCETGKICFNPNTATAIGQMGKLPISSSNTTVTLWASNFKRDGYGFAGWSDAYDYATNPNANFYGPMETITFTAGQYTGSNNGLSLYAVWIKSAGTIQNWNGCSSISIGDVTALTDNRDNDTYAVAKLADNKCWTIENLRLADKNSNNNDINLSSSNTHNPSLPLTNTWWYSSTNDSDTKPTSNHLSATTNPTSTTWCRTNSSNCVDQSMLATNNTTLFVNNTPQNYNAAVNIYSYGNYYNWYSATAGHGKYGSDYGNYYTAPGDICPAGWHLPTGTSSGEYYALNLAVNAGSTSTTAGLRAYPANFVYSGYVDRGEIINRNSIGTYASSSGSNSGNYGLYIDAQMGGGVTPGTMNYGRYQGETVRCVADV